MGRAIPAPRPPVDRPVLAMARLAALFNRERSGAEAGLRLRGMERGHRTATAQGTLRERREVAGGRLDRWSWAGTLPAPSMQPTGLRVQVWGLGQEPAARGPE